jgi:hypothetical protein
MPDIPQFAEFKLSSAFAVVLVLCLKPGMDMSSPRTPLPCPGAFQGGLGVTFPDVEFLVMRLGNVIATRT